MANGYATGEYAGSFAAIGRPRHLPACGGWIVERAIPGTARRDAIGCYPVFCCGNWRALPDDLAALDDLVSLTLVTDPFAALDADLLRRGFDRVAPFKHHYVAAPGDVAKTLPRKHVRNIERARARVDVRRCEVPLDQFDAWCAMYEAACARLGVTELRRFSRDAFRRQLAVPGLLAFGAWLDGDLVGLHLWYVDGDKAYAHLSAIDERGQAAMASYVLLDRAVEHFLTRVALIDFGAGAGYRADATDGLSRFKSGWAPTTRPVFLCCKVLDADAYEALAAGRTGDFFPAYRDGF